jgi:hypothetical protein
MENPYIHRAQAKTAMAITLQVVGLFFKASIDNLPDNVNVLKVLQAAQAQAAAGGIPNVSQFDFSINAGSGGVSSFRVKYQKPFNGREVQPPRSYSAGEYFLAENLNPTPSYSVWQYYVVDAQGKNISRGIKFPQDPNATVPDGGTLIWRLVTILSAPTSASPASETALVNS